MKNLLDKVISQLTGKTPCITEMVLLFLITMVTRFNNLCQPDCVCWDETHFGKFASFYLKAENYFDVHPPLGKMMLALFGFVSGYDGTFSFEEPGQEYGETRFCGMRGFCALLGSAVPPLVYLAVSSQVFTSSTLHL